MRRKNARDSSHPLVPHRDTDWFARVLSKRWGASFTQKQTKKKLLGSAFGFGEMVSKPGPSRPGVQANQ